MRKVWYLFGAMLSVLALTGAGCATSEEEKGPSPKVEENKTNQQSQAVIKPEIDVKDQNIIDKAFLISKVVVPKKSWVVIHQDVNGQPGQVIGYVGIEKGENYNVSIDVDKSKLMMGKYIAVIHVDDGAVGVYEFPGQDNPLKDGDNVVMKGFKATRP